MSEIQNRIEGTLCPKCEGSFLRGQVAAKVKGKYYHKDCIKQNKVAGETAGKTGETAGESRDEQGRFMPGASGNPKGGNSQTEEEKLVKKAIKELVKEY
ncbi:MAG TPA: hypothetical protein ENI13_00340 [candidate division CPR3 bacterium]|uniref:Uncharacterized protein n=1 Tax=candidate division CPR3 bacterium TaxID=2268181 RepID=A0A7C1P590_UNCC3|nr:hypothetical protein [candidate division CPR3 bacterium]